jgi:hypothetical protein
LGAVGAPHSAARPHAEEKEGGGRRRDDGERDAGLDDGVDDGVEVVEVAGGVLVGEDEVGIGVEHAVGLVGDVKGLVVVRGPFEGEDVDGVVGVDESTKRGRRMLFTHAMYKNDCLAHFATLPYLPPYMLA